MLHGNNPVSYLTCIFFLKCGLISENNVLFVLDILPSPMPIAEEEFVLVSSSEI